MLPVYLQDAAAAHRLKKARQQTIKRRRRTFTQQYWNDPAAFTNDCFDWKDDEGLTVYQEEILTNIVTYNREAARGPHGMGKTALAAYTILWFALTRDGEVDWKCPTTASNWRQLTKFLWPEVHKWARLLRWDKVRREPFDLRTELQMLSLKLSTGEAFAVASDNPGYIEGAHADSLLYVFDEAKLIPSVTFDAAEGAFAGAGADTGLEAFALATSTPGETSGRFYEIHTRKPGTEDWHARHVTKAEAIAAKRMSVEWAEARERQWGKKSQLYKNRVEGEFADSDTDSVIPLSWVELAHERWRAQNGKGKGERVLGVDPARFGDDKTTIADLVGSVVETIQYHAKEDTMQTVGRVVAAANKDTPIGVDVIGIGAGVYDRLDEQDYNVTAVNVAQKTDLRDASGLIGFVNLRSAIWWILREAISPDNPDPIALPPDDILTGDLTAPKYRYVSTGQIQVESKDEIRKRLGRSTDAADGVGIAVYVARFAGMNGSVSFDDDVEDW